MSAARLAALVDALLPQRCPGCGSLLAACDGPVHAYMLSTPACWQAFGALVAREYADPALMEVHRLTVDTWAVQHPGDGSRRAIQSVGLHLCRLTLQLEHGFSGRRASKSPAFLCTTMNTSCVTSSSSAARTPRRRSVCHT